uniref:Translocating chain-associated membrane protein 2-like n=1 Tax=Sinocyclocheilus anshuiensis TaxID=1608454 RepID=A0A671Q2V1_9TELE
MAFRRRNKSYPFFSQEFLIQNHADIVFSLVIFILIGLMFETTAKTAILFIQPQYNISTMSADGEVTLYLYGWKDCATVVFYLCITIILHAVVQEYVLDKVNRRLHLSKSKNTKFNESGQLCVFYLVSSLWSLYVIATEGYLLHPSSLWENYPHVHLRFQVKFFYLTQLAYWFHALPELYFQKVRKEEIPRQLQYISLYLLHILAAYLLGLRVGLPKHAVNPVSFIGFHVNLHCPLGNNILCVCVSQNVTLKNDRHWFCLWLHVVWCSVMCLSSLTRAVVCPAVGHHENGLIKAENGTSPRLKKIKAP